MARLNEPAAAAAAGDIETLRRKFLRQNRDIARINSTQSLRIRSLENECARMLSENLDLRGQVLRLEAELQEDRTQRIAEHALEIKEKMEAQLMEWGTMLASLGNEPMPKNRSPRASKKARLQSSFGHLSTPRYRRRNTEELESAALHEGRLAPLWENRSCPRETLNREEILALCSEAAEPAESNGSPDLGPPPVSRFVDEEPVKIDLPTQSPPPSRALLAREDLQPAPSPSRIPEPTEAYHPEPVDEDESQDEPAAEPMEQTKPASPANTLGRKPMELQRIPDLSPSAISKNLKRKMRDEDEKETVRAVRSEREATKLAKGSSATTAAKGGSMNRPMKAMSVKRDAKEASANLPSVTVSRKPLAARTTNEVIQSPTKTNKPAAVDEVVKAKAEAKRHDQSKGRTAKPKSRDEAPAAPAPAPVAVPLPEPAAEPVVASIELEAISADPNLSAPTSPASITPCEETRDTPPPFDISNSGETSRPSRRNRTAVSYAEPNLRDKMRRPSKQLLDAVAGEGKGIRRSSSSSKHSGDFPSIKSEEKSAQAWKSLPAPASIPAEAPASPLAEKVLLRSPAADLPTSVVTDRRKRNSSNMCQAGIGGSESADAEEPTTKAGAKPTNRQSEGIAVAKAETRPTSEESGDVYEFPDSSPATNANKHAAPEDGKRASSKSRQSKGKRMPSAMGEESKAEAAEPQSRGVRAANSKKRASMMAPRSARITESDLSRPDSPVDGDSMNSLSSADTDGPKDRAAARRRSMML